MAELMPRRLVLLDSKLSRWQSHQGGPANWKVSEEYLEVVPGLGDIETTAKFLNFELHLEFWLPLMADKKGQDRANSGVFLQGRYEIQILDSLENETEPERACGALYNQCAPLSNAVTAPQTWQNLDILFKAPRFNLQDTLVDKGSVSAHLNGVLILKQAEIYKLTDDKDHQSLVGPGPIRLQDHGCPVRFRNLWIRPLL